MNGIQNGLTESEKFVNKISERAFLSLWTHPNPKGKKDKELCDCLIVCNNHIIIISVKDIKYKETDDDTGWKRWMKAAIDKSVDQIWGAERWLNSESNFIRHDGREVDLPDKSLRKIHRISVSLGANRKIPITSGNLGHGFVHVCDENSLGAVFGLLDTITDLVNFLSAVEDLNSRASLIFNGGGIEDLMALFLMHNYELPYKEADLVLVGDDIFSEFVKSEEYEIRQIDFQSSYFWDRLIEYYTKDLLTDGMFDYNTQKQTNNQLALIQMALQPRAHRANLADVFIEFLENPELKVAARAVVAYNGTAFVFQLGSSGDREARIAELGMRCLIIRGRAPDVKIVVGIACDRPGSSKIGYSSDIAYLEINEWNNELDSKVEYIRDTLGYFKNLSFTKRAHA